MTEQQQPSGAAPAGWYPDPNGQMRWWDGQQWGQVAAASTAAAGTSMDPKTMAVLAEVLGIFTGFVGPLIIYIVNGEKDPFVRHHAAESLNFHITLFIGYMISFVLMIVLVGFVTFFVIWIVGLIFMIQASMAASRGEWYRYPINIRFVSGAVGG